MELLVFAVAHSGVNFASKVFARVFRDTSAYLAQLATLYIRTDVYEIKDGIIFIFYIRLFITKGKSRSRGHLDDLDYDNLWMVPATSIHCSLDVS